MEEIGGKWGTVASGGAIRNPIPRVKEGVTGPTGGVERGRRVCAVGHTGFFGTFTPRLDDKGRVTLPARYREVFAPGVMVVKGQDRCLYLFTPAGFDEFADAAINASITDSAARAYQRFMLSNTEDQRPDGQGRITLSARMRDYAGLSKDAVIVGVGRRMEIWDAQAWAAYEQEQEAAYADLNGDLFGKP